MAPQCSEAATDLRLARPGHLIRRLARLLGCPSTQVPSRTIPYCRYTAGSCELIEGMRIGVNSMGVGERALLTI